ncbi:muconolactone Delta-isomerase family protein [Pseudorhodoferax sp. LjRoot39]|uniref:muconolactone Delta-isomerase n=1 Tax=Pseudorhodoferax sp. LjRoot39 TaxID=3342328 RepID=UPI003ED16ECC
MLYCTRIQVRIPADMAPEAVNALRQREKDRAVEMQQEGKLVHLWRVAGQAANVSVWDCASHDEFHALLSSLPMFPYFEIEVIPLARHPSAIAG